MVAFTDVTFDLDEYRKDDEDGNGNDNDDHNSDDDDDIYI